MKDDSDLTLGIAIAIAVLSSIYNEFKEVNFKQDFLSLTNIPLTHLNNIKYLLLIILIISILLKLIQIKIKNLKIKEDNFKEKLSKASKIEELNELNKNKLAKKYPKEINKIKREIKDKERKLREKEEEKQRELEEQELYEEELRIKENRQIKKLIKYFNKKQSNEAIPEFALTYFPDVIEKAQNKYEKLREKEKSKEEKWKTAVSFVLKHKAYPSNFYSLNENEKLMYKKAIKLLKENKLKEENIDYDNAPEEDKELLEKRFYHAEELKPEIRDKLIKKYGYESYSGLFRDGKSGNNVIIKNYGKRESNYHFHMKHVFAEIDKQNSKVEYSIDGLRADVAFIYSKKKIAVEIETKSNKQLQISNKVKWLNKYFDYWVFVCSRENKKYYSRYVDNKKSFCLTLKDADRKVVEMIRQ